MKISFILYRDPTSSSDQVDVTPGPWNTCGGYDEVYYAQHACRHLGYSRYEPPTPATGELVEFEPPATLAELFGYSEEQPSIVRRVLASLGGTTSWPSRIDVAGVKMLGVRLTCSPGTPAIPPDVDFACFPQVTSLRACGVVVEVRPVE